MIALITLTRRASLDADAGGGDREGDTARYGITKAAETVLLLFSLLSVYPRNGSTIPMRYCVP
jgi:hypothetical protein